MTRTSSKKPPVPSQPKVPEARAPRDDERVAPLSQRREEYESIGDGCYHRMPAKPHE